MKTPRALPALQGDTGTDLPSAFQRKPSYQVKISVQDSHLKLLAFVKGLRIEKMNTLSGLEIVSVQFLSISTYETALSLHIHQGKPSSHYLTVFGTE